MELGGVCTLRTPCPRRCYATASTGDTCLCHSLRRYATCVRFTSDGWKDAYCDELYYFACKKPAGALSTPRIASISTRQNERSKNFTERPHRPSHLPAPLRPLSLFVSGAVAVTRCPCGQVCSPVLLHSLLITPWTTGAVPAIKSEATAIFAPISISAIK